jgi:hypothetical protein
MHRHVPSIPPHNDPPPIFTAADPTAKPIRVAPRTQGKKHPNVFYDNHGFPDQSKEFDVILYNISGGCILQSVNTQPLPLMISIHCFTHLTLRPSTAQNCTINWTFSIWMPLSAIRYTASSRNTGQFLAIKDNLSPSRTAVPSRHYVGRMGCHIYGWSARQCRTSHLGYTRKV